MKAYHVTSLTKWSLRAMPAPASKMEEWLSPLKSVETTCRRARERLTRKLTGKLFQDQGEETNAYLVLCVSQDALHGSFSCSLDDLLDVTGFSRRTVRSTTDTLGVGTRKAMPVNLLLSSGMTLPTALAAPVEAGMMFWLAPRPSLHSLPEGPSTVFWVAVMA
uniref:Uncharacterized protein n=1 Tax=Sparus aurata TaxID=8175 RepID=A0A671WJS9_SPAAU